MGVLMPERISPDKERQILIYFFEGVGVKEIMTILGLSERTIRGRTSDLNKRAKEVGVVKAAAEKNVDIYELHRLAEYRREKEVDYKQIEEGISVASSGKTLGCKLDDVEKLMNTICEELITKGYPQEKFTANAYALREAANKLDKPYDEAVAEYDELGKKLKQIKDSIRLAENTKQISEEELKTTYENNQVTEAEINTYVPLRKALKTYNVEINHFEKLKTLLDNVTQYMEKPSELVDYYSETVEANQKLSETRTETQVLDEKKSELVEEIERLQLEINDKHESIEAADILIEAGIKPRQAKTIADTVKEVAVKNGYPRSTAIEELVSYLDNYYDATLTAKYHAERLSKEYDSLQRLYNELKVSYNRLQEENKGTLEAIQSLRLLNEKGIGNQDLFEWRLIMDEHNLDPNTLRREINRLKGVKEAVNELRREVDTLTVNKQSLTNEVNNLESRREKLDEEVLELQATASKKIDELSFALTSTIRLMEEEVLSPVAGLSPRVTGLVEESVTRVNEALSVFETVWRNQFSNLSAQINASAETVAKLEAKSMDAGKVLGGIIHLESAVRILQGTPITESEANIAVLVIISHLMNYMNTSHLNRSYGSLEAFLPIYLGEVGGRIQ